MTGNLSTGCEDFAAGLRPIDLARAANISPSLVRLYETEGFIPPAIRTESGHRRYTHAHLRTLLVARALRAGYGWKLGLIAMQAFHRGDHDAALAVGNQRHAQLHTEANRLTRALAAIDNAHPETSLSRPTRDGLSIGAAAEHLQVTPATLRHWELAGVTSPARLANGRRIYTPSDIQQLELVQVLRDAGYRFKSIAELMAGLKTNDRAQTRTALATRQAQLHRQSRAAAIATSQLIQLIEHD